MDRVLHLTIYLTDMADRAAFNEVYQRFFSKPWPVRAAVGVAALAFDGARRSDGDGRQALTGRRCRPSHPGCTPSGSQGRQPFRRYNARLTRDSPKIQRHVPSKEPAGTAQPCA